MYLFYAILTSCLAVLPPGSSRSQSQASASLQFQVSSNPSQDGSFYLDLSQCHQGDWIQIRITDVINREVKRISIPPDRGSRVHIDLSDKPPGYYMLEVVQGSCRQIRRLMCE
ncbi:MAG: T9SS type A sorting domain-containing protein [Bacteroidia bacterium]|nr:T9SS type A sorting domain-containing protein [Bacteroidia bacterium]